MAQQGQRAVADEVDGGLVAGDVQQHDERHQLGGGEAVAGLLDEQQLRQQVVARGARRRSSMTSRRYRPSAGRRLVGRLHRRVVGGRLQRRRERLRPVADLGLAFGGHAQQVGDHLERHREGQLVDQLHRAALGRAVEDVVDQLLDPRTEPLDGRRGERQRDEAAQPGVIGRVEAEDALGRLARLVAPAEHLPAPGARRVLPRRPPRWPRRRGRTRCRAGCGRRRRSGSARRSRTARRAPGPARAAGRRTGRGRRGTPGRTG